ncbi:MAG: DUF1570 domain-containing protein [Planctomycetia bacterium]|nr:DUF1570 domain-containing protein [Planctomycetia bacterium]
MRALVTIATMALFLAGAIASAADDPPRRTIEVEVQGQRVEGMPVFWSIATVELLSRDGRIWSFRPEDAKKFKQVSSSFQSYPQSVMRQRLQAELGNAFHVVGTGHYLVALPEGAKTNWADRFEELYRSFELYFSVRGFRLKNPEFPLVAIVWPNQQSFLRAAHADGSGAGANVLGYYSPISNRIMLYDLGNGSGSANDWRETAATIIHEATHQTAFNTGIHQRFGQTPQWVVEGLGTMFEAPGVWNSRTFLRREDRINRGRFDYFRKYAAKDRKPGTIQDLIGSDRMFASNTAAAYAEAWALSFYLVETQPRKYSEYLALTAKRPPFEPYPAGQRLSDFTSVFGTDFRMLEARFLRFMAELR